MVLQAAYRKWGSAVALSAARKAAAGEQAARRSARQAELEQRWAEPALDL